MKSLVGGMKLRKRVDFGQIKTKPEQRTTITRR